MSEGERSLYLENPKRPYSWTGELDTPPSPDQIRNGSLKITKSFPISSKGRTDLNFERRSKGTGRESCRSNSSGRGRGHFNFPRSGSQLLSEKLPSYLSEGQSLTPSSDQLPQKLPQIEGPKAPQQTNLNKSSSFCEKKKSRFGNLKRKSPPAMTSHVSDFEYFSLSDPPPGLARPVQIFPNSVTEKPPQKHQRITQKTPVTKKKGEKCRDCMTRIPYATLIATIMCCGGVGVFCGTMYRGTTLTLLMFDEVFHIKITWDREFRVEPVKLTFMIIGAAMGGLGLMILFLGCLSTGSTRAKVYRTWRGRVGGRVSCAIFMGITYLLSVVWLLIFIMLVIVTSFYTIALFQCKTIPWEQCIDYNQFAFLFPPTSTEEDRRVCDIDGEKKTYCHDCVNNSVVMFLLATGAAFFVIMSLIHYLMCLSSNYAHIKDQEKFIDLQEIQYLHESEMSTLPKDRF